MRIVLTYLFALALFSCSKKEGITPITNTEASKGTSFLVLNEGLWNNNDASITKIDEEGIEKNWFSSLSGRRLGDVANDMLLYGSKLYVAVNGSNTLEIIDVENEKVLAQLSLTDGGEGKGPRQLLANDGKLYLSCFSDEVLVVDTANLKINATVTVGRDPEAMAVSGSMLYVVNSGGLDFPNYDNTVSVIDISTLQLVKTIQVNKNPGQIIEAGGSLYVLCRGDYVSEQPSLLKIDGTDKVSSLSNLPDNIRAVKKLDDRTLLLLSENTATNDYYVHKLDVGTANLQSQAVLLKDLVTFYGLEIEPKTGDWYVCDAKSYSSNGLVYVYRSGQLVGSYEAGMLPQKCVFIN